MKKLISRIALASALLFLPIGSAQAYDSCHGSRIVGYTPCGKPIVAYRQIVGRDHCGRPAWDWVTRYPSSCHCRSHHWNSSSRGHCDPGRGQHRPANSWGSFFRF